ncbi:MAG: carbohydrate binding family 9 domain-containing protein, partial [Chitinophagaceae bacterium]|nr:carbohydrate binding family 9 domain-containing protein [Chitinophagaceae bacterium]
MTRLFLSLMMLSCLASNAQTVKQIPAVRTVLPIVLDGVPNEDAWKQSPVISDLIEMRPTFGRAEDPVSKSRMFLLYDNDFVYFGGYNLERTRDNVATQLAGRDEVGVNDFVGIIFDTYQDKINGLGFYVTPLNEQFDVKYSIGNEDMSWNAVYHTQTQVTDSGWSFEMRIPYSALRFSKEKLQNWNINILRRRAKLGQQFSWSPVDPTKFGFMNQSGIWAGIQDIKPPVRLSFSPYFSSYLTRNGVTNNNWETSVNGGMDVKYGISDGFTMDMTLIPDFGQVQSDN